MKGYIRDMLEQFSSDSTRSDLDETKMASCFLSSPSMTTIFVCVSLMLLAAAPVYSVAQLFRQGSIQKDQPAEGEIPIKEFREQTLKAHNDRRRKHGVPDLTLSAKLNDVAQQWAENLVRTNSFKHSRSEFGENLAYKAGTNAAKITGDEVTEMWYSEISMHDYDGEFNSATGHFTQVVWKDTKEVGVGRATGRKGQVIVVANYSPPGNTIGQFSENVFPPK